MSWTWETSGPEGQAWILKRIEQAGRRWTPPPPLPARPKGVPALGTWQRIRLLAGWPVNGVQSGEVAYSSVVSSLTPSARGRCFRLPWHAPVASPATLIDPEALMDIVAVMAALAEQGITVLFKADTERMRDGSKPWTFVASGKPFHEGVLVRTDAASVERCLEICLPQLREFGLSIPE